MNRNILFFFLNCVLFLKTDITQTGSLSNCWLVTAAAASLNIAVKTSVVVVADKLMGDVIASLNSLFFPVADCTDDVWVQLQRLSLVEIIN